MTETIQIQNSRDLVFKLSYILLIGYHTTIGNYVQEYLITWENMGSKSIFGV